MTGQEHYREAERLLEEVRGNNQNPQITYAEDAANLAAAQVHATLALTAATVLPAVNRWFGDESLADKAWMQATS